MSSSKTAFMSRSVYPNKRPRGVNDYGRVRHIWVGVSPGIKGGGVVCRRLSVRPASMVTFDPLIKSIYSWFRFNFAGTVLNCSILPAGYVVPTGTLKTLPTPSRSIRFGPFGMPWLTDMADQAMFLQRRPLVAGGQVDRPEPHFCTPPRTDRATSSSAADSRRSTRGNRLLDSPLGIRSQRRPGKRPNRRRPRHAPQHIRRVQRARLNGRISSSRRIVIFLVASTCSTHLILSRKSPRKLSDRSIYRLGRAVCSGVETRGELHPRFNSLDPMEPRSAKCAVSTPHAIARDAFRRLGKGDR